jgi:hydrogenase maturation protein HypF
MLIRREYLLRGVVQGVGFRPHVAVVAARYPLTGLVGNDDRQVFLEVQGSPEVLDAFVAELLASLPPLARVIAVTFRELPAMAEETGFRIVASRHLPGVRTLIPPDVATCDHCLADMADPANRRFGYAFTTCTNCGPRLTIIEDLPYDRPSTTMRVFEMCPSCAAEYTNPADRRFHAQPISCYDCGPQLWLVDSPTPQMAEPTPQMAEPTPQMAEPTPQVAELVEAPNSTLRQAQGTAASQAQGTAASQAQGTVTSQAQGTDARRAEQTAVIAEARRRLLDGQIIAVKGLGGFHLMCNARDAAAVARLRERKRRSGKPFAVMVADAAAASALAELSPDQRGQLTSPARPILLAPMAEGYDLADDVAPGLGDVGLMLPYTPLHTLLLADVEPGRDSATPTAQPPQSPPTRLALVATSGNLSEEPLCFTNADALARLAHLADAFLLHDRDIHVPVEDSVMLALPGSDALPIRRSRGHAPLPVLLPRTEPSTLNRTQGRPSSAPLAPVSTGSAPLAPVSTGSAPLAQFPELVEGSPSNPPVVLGVGGELKNTFTLASDDLAFVSAHVGDMGSLASQQAFEASVAQLLNIHRREPEVLVCDLHPGYATTAWAERYVEAHPGVRLIRVQHHYAHALSLLAEYGIASGPVVVAALDGTGYGGDGTIWGGEILTLGADGTSPANWERTWHVPTFALVGGDRAIRHPWRIAQGLAHSWGLDVSATPATTGAPEAELRLVASQLVSGQGVVATSSTGRLFDAAAATLGLCLEATYEAHAAMALERAASEWARSVGRPALQSFDTRRPGQAQGTELQQTLRQAQGPEHGQGPGTEHGQGPGTEHGQGQRAESQAAELVEASRPDDFNEVFTNLLARPERSAGERAWRFHQDLAAVFAERIAAAAERAHTTTVGLTGGVVVNRIFTAALVADLQARRLTVLTHRVAPPTDGGLSLGQAWAGRLLDQ